MSFALAATIAMDGSKLPSSVIFKGTPGDIVEISPTFIVSDSIIECVQPKTYMDNRTMTIQYNSVVKP